MPNNKAVSSIRDQLADSIADVVGNQHEDDLEEISSGFDRTLADALKVFNSTTFDDDGFIRKMRTLNLDGQQDKDMMRNVLNNVRSDYINAESLNQSELLLRRDLNNICTQMPEMRDVIYVVRDAIIECNVATGEVSRALSFENHEKDEAFQSQVKDIERRHDILMAIKNFVVPNTLRTGEMYIHVVPYAKLFAEIEALRDSKQSTQRNYNQPGTFKESIPNTVWESFKESVSLYSEDNLKAIMESAAPVTKAASSDTYHVDAASNVATPDSINKTGMATLLRNIDVYNGSSIMMSEMGYEGMRALTMMEYQQDRRNFGHTTTKETHFSEAMDYNRINNSVFGNIDQDDVDTRQYNDIRGCYVKYLNPLRTIPIRMDRRVIGYYYVSTTMDLATNPANPNGMVDLSFQHYTKDKNIVDRLASMIIKSFDKKMLERNIKLKSEIAEIIMAHKFSEGRLSFIYIPETEIVRLIINEDEEGKGHSILEPSIFPARSYLMLTLYNMLYTLNNNTTRVHYLKSSGMNKDYAAQIQRTMRKFQSRRITIDDIYSYSGVLNKVGGMGEMILPAGRNDFKALETDTIEAVQNPINIEFLEQQRRQAISGTGVPHLLVINAIDEVDFAKTLEMANTRFLSTVSSYKIDFNRGLTKWYQLLMKWDTDMEDDVIQSFRFQFNQVKQQELTITSEMIQNFNAMVELVMSIFFKKSDMEDDKGNPTAKQMHLRLELAKKYIPQMDYDDLEDIVNRVNLAATNDQLQDKVGSTNITDEDIKEVT